MSDDLQAIFLEAVPLLVLAALYLLVSILLAVPLARERGSSALGFGIWLLFTIVGVVAALLGFFRLADRDVLDVPSGFVVAGAAVVAVPALIFLWRRGERSLLVTAGRRVFEAEERATERGREADAITRLSRALAGTVTAREAAEHLFDELDAVLEVDCAFLATVDEETRTASGFAARRGDEEWWQGISLDLDEDPGAIATVARERAARAVYDVGTEPKVNRTIAHHGRGEERRLRATLPGGPGRGRARRGHARAAPAVRPV